MSIVERALSKMQAGAKTAPVQVFGKIVEVARPEGSSTPAEVPSRVVAINQPALLAAGLLPPQHQARQLANQYRQIKRPLVANAFGRGKPALPNGQFIMVASAMSGEGKTFTTINLALSIARERDVQVVLVDADVIKPQIGRMLGIDQERGLLDALAEPHLDVRQLILSTDIPNLSALPAGRYGDNATELLASARMGEVMHQMVRGDPTRIVLLDSPPLMLTTESRTLAQVAGQIIVVVQADQTRQDVLIEALSYLPEGVETSLILNHSARRQESSSYYYGYEGSGDRPASE